MEDLRPKNKLYQDLKMTEKYFGGVLPFEVLIKIKPDNNKQNESVLDQKVLNLSKQVEELLKSELRNSRFFSINNLIESAKRIRFDNAEIVSENQLIEQIIKSQSDGDVKLVNEDQSILRITGLIEDKTSDEMKNIYSN